MDERQGETDGETAELAVFMTTVSDAEDNHQEHEGEKSLHEECSACCKLEVSVTSCCCELRTIAVGCENTSVAKTCSFPDDHKQCTCDDAAQNLCSPVNEHLFETHASVSPHAETHRRVEMSARDVTDAVSHSYNCQTKSYSYTEKTYLSEECCAASSENQNECAEQLGEKLVTCFHDYNF